MKQNGSEIGMTRWSYPAFAKFLSKISLISLYVCAISFLLSSTIIFFPYTDAFLECDVMHS